MYLSIYELKEEVEKERSSRDLKNVGSLYRMDWKEILKNIKYVGLLIFDIFLEKYYFKLYTKYSS